MVAKETVLVIPDLHYPFAHPDHLVFLKELTALRKPTRVICLGDEVDMHALSDYDADPDGFSPGDELEMALLDMQTLYKTFPKVMVCTSNHTSRPLRKAFKAGIPKAFLRDYRDWLKAPRGWKWRDEWILDDVKYEHGEGFTGVNGALKSAQGNMQSTVIGHLHSFAGVTYNANPRRQIFAMNAGCLIDASAYAFAYGKKMKNKPVLGAGLVTRGVPQFTPMLLDKHGRWVGKL